MSDLLEVIAESDTSVLNGWAAVFNDRAPQFGALPEHERSRELLTLARAFTRRAAWATETAEGWLTELQARLRDGMGGHKFRALLHSGRTLCRMCLSVVEIAGDLWRLAEAAVAPNVESQAAGGVLSGARRRLAAVETAIDEFGGLVERPYPDMDEEKIAQGKRQIEAGKGLTREQALAAIRKGA
jgi:hypothetical protein